MSDSIYLERTVMMKASDKLRENICEKRKEKNITQAVMAEKLGLSETGYAKIERGETRLDIDRIQKIANILEISIADLIPFGDDSIVACNNSDFSNSTNFSFILGSAELEHAVVSLKHQLAAKDDIIDTLKQQIATLEQVIMNLTHR